MQRVSHRRRIERPVGLWLLLLAGALPGCVGDDLQESIWPPPDFACVVEQLQFDGSTVQVTRRLRVEADGLCVYGTSGESLIDWDTGTTLPVFERLCAYRLVPACVRSFARRLDRLGIAELDTNQGERNAIGATAVVLSWQAFGKRRRISARGRLHGPMVEVLNTVLAHLPAGERFIVPGNTERVVVPVLRAVPAPVDDALGALRLHQRLVAERPDDRELLLDAFALACRAGQREEALVLAQQWQAADARERAATGTFADDAGSPALLDFGVLERLLPAAAGQ
jgi:hypothetical protein